MILCTAVSAAPKAVRPAKAPARSAPKRVYDPVAEAYKQEQQARLVYWVYTYQRALAAIQHGNVDPVRPYPRQPIIDALFEEMCPAAQAYARKLLAVEKRTMQQHALASAVNRAAVTKGIQAILAGLREEQKLLDKMPVRY